MAISTQKNTLNLQPGCVPTVVHLSLADVGNTIGFYLYDGSEIFIPNDCVISVHGVRQDGTGFGPFPVTITIDSNYVTFPVDLSMTSVPGAVVAELTISNGSASVGTANFGMIVEEGTFPYGPTYENDVSIYQQILNYVQTFPGTVQTQINAEISAREAADDTLQTNINTVNADLQESLSEETDAREAADAELEQALADETTARIYADSVLSTQIDTVRSQVGSPLVATTASAMTDHTRVYVYTGSEDGYTAGHWYYWTGSAWTDGGVYQSAGIETDTTLSLYGVAADAMYTGNGINHTKADLYELDEHDVWFDEKFALSGKFFSRPNTKALTLVSNNGTMCCLRPYRITAGTTYYYMHLYAYFCVIIYDDGEIGYLSDNTEANLSGTFTPTKNGNIYFVIRVNNNTTVPMLAPNIFAPLNGKSFLLYNMSNLHTDYIKPGKVRLASIPENRIGNAHWKTQYISSDLLGATNQIYDITNNVLFLGYNASANTKVMLLPIRVYAGKTYHYKHLYPYFCIVRYDSGTISRLSSNTAANLSGTFTPSGDGWVYITVSTVTYSDWQFADGALPDAYVVGAYHHNTVVVAQDGSGDFSKLIDAFAYCNENPDTTVYVKEGTYDIISELGSTYVDTNTSGRGPEIGNNAHFIFSTKAVVTANYSGSRQWMNATFSPINISGEGGVTFENMRIMASKVRYCIHDDRLDDADSALPYHNHYINCDMYMNNSQNPNWTSKQCIGGGLGTNGEIIIDGCRFKSEGSTANNGVVSYHNCSLANSKSKITVKNCYFEGAESGVRFGWYGQSTLISDIFLIGNSWTTNPVLRAETTDGTSPYQNLWIISWNNELRT